MQSLSIDTTPEAQRKMFELLRDVPPNKKLALTFELIQTMRLMVLAGLRRRFPAADEAELKRRLIARLLPREDIIEAYGFDPDMESR
ncbi:MAG TPA: hypothetical protein VFU37_03920 [Pyrinomonadaceae bacterium]|nr:hypothetical protein [Pyrinomonadaceae bacterium]